MLTDVDGLPHYSTEFLQALWFMMSFISPCRGHPNHPAVHQTGVYTTSVPS